MKKIFLSLIAILGLSLSAYAVEVAQEGAVANATNAQVDDLKQEANGTVESTRPQE